MNILPWNCSRPPVSHGEEDKGTGSTPVVSSAMSIDYCNNVAAYLRVSERDNTVQVPIVEALKLD